MFYKNFTITKALEFFKKHKWPLLFIIIFLFFVSVSIAIKVRQSALLQAKLKEQLQDIEQRILITQNELDKLLQLTPEEKNRRLEELKILSAQSALTDVPVAGLEIVKSDGKKIIKNIAEGYRLEAPANLVVARSISSDWLELHDQETMCEGDPLCGPILRIVVSKDDINNIVLEAESYERLNIGGAAVYRVAEVIPAVFEGSYYYWSRNGKVYSIRVSSFDESAYRKYIETFRLE